MQLARLNTLGVLGLEGGGSTGELRVRLLLSLVQYLVIDVTCMMTMFTINIWGDRHASACNSVLLVSTACTRGLSDRAHR